MQSLWQHPNFLQLQSNPSFELDLKRADLHSNERLKNLTLHAPHWTIWLAHQDFTEAAFRQLNLLALNRQALNWMHAMQRGELVNNVEGNTPSFAALHTALRAQSSEGMLELAKSVWHQAHQERARIREFLDTHQSFKRLIILGIGGSQLGPEALYEALKPLPITRREVIFIPNIDPAAHEQVARSITLEDTLVAAISKSGSTLETAESERWWRSEFERQGLDSKEHMVAITTTNSQLDRPHDFLSCFYFDPSIGGRYSATSSVGAVPIAFAYGMDVFERLLLGASEMDKHAVMSDCQLNAPLALACVSIWQRQIKRRMCQGIIAYRQCLHRFAAHLQQLEMESLGKCTDRQGKPIEGSCGALIMGEPGTCAQHSFFQWMHQGTDCVPLDFIIETQSMCQNSRNQFMADQLLANALAQSLALARGHQSAKEHQTCPGGRPSTILACRRLSPEAIGSLLALYEHKTAFEGFVLGINPFDQEGVELGKRMARDLYQEIEDYRAGRNSPKFWWQTLVQST